ncbi:hypothetical protein TWF173_009747 [Orbilia oligospora]|nr:hypothetical protein TWF173_009747 [Orbilia oligospora]
MATITALPTEVLLEVFELLDIESLTNAKTVCKQFRAVIRMIPLRSYTLRIDEPKHSMWKFTRFLLSDPKAGSQITDLTVEWCRREPDDPDTWTDKWEWTEKDLGIMKGLEETVIDKYLTPETTWFHLNTGYPGNYLPGLSRLKKFNHQLNGDALVAEYKWGWRADYFLPILFIPGIEEITIGGCATDEEVDGYTLKTIMGWYEEQFKGVPPSTVRKLVIRDARMYEKDYELIADYTCCLEKLHISYNDNFTELGSYYDMADAIYVFFKNNPKLRMDNLYVDGRPNEAWLKIFHDRDYDLLRGEDEYRERTYEEFVEEFEAWSQRRALQDEAK